MVTEEKPTIQPTAQYQHEVNLTSIWNEASTLPSTGAPWHPYTPFQMSTRDSNDWTRMRKGGAKQTRCWCSWKDYICFTLNLLRGVNITMMLKKSMVSSFHVMFLPPIMDVANTCSNICFGWTRLCPPKHDHWRKGTHTPNCDCLALLQREVRHLIAIWITVVSPPKMNITVFPFGFRTWARLLDKLRFPV